MKFGFFLVMIGVLLLLHKMDLLPPLSWDYVLPVLLIAWGLAIILRKGLSWGRPRKAKEEKDEASGTTKGTIAG